MSRTPRHRDSAHLENVRKLQDDLADALTGLRDLRDEKLEHDVDQEDISIALAAVSKIRAKLKAENKAHADDVVLSQEPTPRTR